MYQFNWVMRYPDIWSNIILIVSMRVFLDEINILIVDWIKQIALPNVGEPHPVSWRPKYNQNADPPLGRGNNFCLTALSYDIFFPVFVLELMGWPCYGKTWMNFCQPSTSLTFLVLSLHSQTGTMPSTFLGLQLTNWRSWGLISLHNYLLLFNRSVMSDCL